jgi:hypothetical protein
VPGATADADGALSPGNQAHDDMEHGDERDHADARTGTPPEHYARQ